MLQRRVQLHYFHSYHCLVGFLYRCAYQILCIVYFLLITHPIAILLPELPDKTSLYRTLINFGGRKYWQIEILVKLILANCHDQPHPCLRDHLHHEACRFFGNICNLYNAIKIRNLLNSFSVLHTTTPSSKAKLKFEGKILANKK